MGKKDNIVFMCFFYLFLIVMGLFGLYVLGDQSVKIGALPIRLTSELMTVVVLLWVCMLAESIRNIRHIELKNSRKQLAATIVCGLLCAMAVLVGLDYVRDLMGGPVETVTNVFRVHSEDRVISFWDEQGEEKWIRLDDRGSFLENMEVLYDDRGHVLMDDHNNFLYKDSVRIKYYPHSEVLAEITQGSAATQE